MNKNTQNKGGNKTKKILAVVASILVAVIVLGVVGIHTFLNSGTMERNTVAAKSEHYTVNSAMLTYLYNTSYQNLVSNAGSYLESLGLDTNKALDQQKYQGDKTWHDYFLDSARSQLTNALVLAEAATAAGVQLDDADKADIDETLSALKGYADTYKVTVDYYIKNVYGNAVTEKDIRACMEILLLAEKYQADLVDSYKYTADDWAKYYAENEEDFLKVDYLSYTFKVEEKKEDKKDSETTAVADKKAADAETTTAADDDKKEPAIEATYAAELAATKTVDEFKAYVKNYLTTVLYKDMTEEELEEDDINIDEIVENCLTEGKTVGGTDDFGKWISDNARDPYETYKTDDEKNGKYTVYMILPAQNEGDLEYACKYRETYVLKDFRYIPVALSSTEKDTTKAKELAKKEANDILDEYKLDETAENFAKLADKYGDGHYEGGLVEAADKNSMDEALMDWVYSADRKAGDCEIVEVEGQGYYVLYFVGDNTTSWEHDADTALKNDKYSEDYDAFVEAHKVTYYKKGVSLVKAA